MLLDSERDVGRNELRNACMGTRLSLGLPLFRRRRVRRHRGVVLLLLSFPLERSLEAIRAKNVLNLMSVMPSEVAGEEEKLKGAIEAGAWRKPQRIKPVQREAPTTYLGSVGCIAQAIRCQLTVVLGDHRSGGALVEQTKRPKVFLRYRKPRGPHDGHERVEEPQGEDPDVREFERQVIRLNERRGILQLER